MCLQVYHWLFRPRIGGIFISKRERDRASLKVEMGATQQQPLARWIFSPHQYVNASATQSPEAPAFVDSRFKFMFRGLEGLAELSTFCDGKPSASSAA